MVRATASKFRRIMSAVGTILFIAQGFISGFALISPWVHTDKNRMSSVGATLTARAFALRLGSAAPLGLNKCVTIINPGLAPWALQEYRPVGAHCPTAPINPTNTIQSQSNTKTQTQQFIYTPKNILRTQYHDTTPQTPNPTKSPERATLLHSPGWNEGKARYETLGKHGQK